MQTRLKHSARVLCCKTFCKCFDTGYV